MIDELRGRLDAGLTVDAYVWLPATL